VTVLHQTEKQFQDAVIEAAHAMQWTVAHFRPARIRKRGEEEDTYVTPVAADGAGFPDLVLVRDRVVFAELKAERGTLSDDQAEWLAVLEGAGVEAYCWRPSDWPHIEQILAARGPRGG
jgi:hypothetical protein